MTTDAPAGIVNPSGECESFVWDFQPFDGGSLTVRQALRYGWFSRSGLYRLMKANAFPWERRAGSRVICKIGFESYLLWLWNSST